MKNFCRNILSVFGLAPYSITLKLAQWCVRLFDSKFELWPRNSFIFDAIEPGFSDLDLTLYVPKESRVKSAHQFLTFANLARKIWPLVGEINLYLESDLELSLANINCFELNRDKFLVKRMNYKEKFDSVEAAVFLFRQLEKDIKNLALNPRRRKKKWSYHFRQIQILTTDLPRPNFPELNENRIVESVVSAIVFLCGLSHSVFSDELSENLDMYFEFLLKDVDTSRLRPVILKDPWLFVFSIHRAAYLETFPFLLSDVQQKVLLLQIKWEIWGLKSQVFENEFAGALTKHKQSLIQKLQRQNSYQWSEDFESLLNSKYAD